MCVLPAHPRAFTKGSIMTTAGRTPGVNHARQVREYFESNRNRDIMLDELRAIIGSPDELADPAKTRRVVKYLRTQRNMRVKVVKRGEVWRYDKVERKNSAKVQMRVPSGSEAAKRIRALANKLDDPIADKKWREAEVIGVPRTEPVVTLRVIGTLKETGEVLVEGDSAQGFESGVWALRKLG